MSFSSGTFTLVAGNPVVTNTTISSTWANNTLNDIATGLTTCVLKDGTQATTASVPFVFGIAVTTAITTPSTTFAIANTTATTVNFAGAATTLSIGAGTGTTTVNNALVGGSSVTANGFIPNSATIPSDGLYGVAGSPKIAAGSTLSQTWSSAGTTIAGTAVIGSATNPVHIGIVSDGATRGLITWNGVLTAAGNMGINGSVALGTLIVNTPTGGGISLRVNNVSVFDVGAGATGVLINGTAGLTQGSTATVGRSITVVNGLVTAFA